MNMDIELVREPVAHVVKCIPQIKSVIHNIGITYMSAFIWAASSSLVFGVIGYFVGKRGLTGTKSDLTNAVVAVEKVPAEIKAAV